MLKLWRKQLRCNGIFWRSCTPKFLLSTTHQFWVLLAHRQVRMFGPFEPIKSIRDKLTEQNNNSPSTVVDGSAFVSKATSIHPRLAGSPSSAAIMGHTFVACCAHFAEDGLDTRKRKHCA